MNIRTIISATIIAITATTALSADGIKPQWSFPKGVQYKYEYTQEMSAQTDFGDEKMADKGDSTIKGSGPVSVICEGNSATIDFSMKIQEMTMGGENAAEQAEQMPALSYKVPLLPDGTIKQGRYGAGGNLQFLFDLMFPLPQSPLKKDEKVVQKMTMFSSGGMSKLDGNATYTYKAERLVDGKKHLDYHVSCDLATDTNAPNQMAQATLKAEIDCTFSLTDGHFVSVKNDLHFLRDGEC
jgi:hypothetical protein